jgi:hypothetical protein
MPWTTQLIDLLERKEKLIAELGDLASQQEAMVRERRGEALLGVLSRRQALIDEVLSMQDELASLAAAAADAEHEAPAAARERIRTLVDAISRGLGAVLERDERDRAAIASAREDTRRELASIAPTRQAHEAYLGGSLASRPETRFADRTG